MKYKDFMPPIFFRIIKRIRRFLRPSGARYHPFDNVPMEIEAKWVLDVGANLGSIAEAALKSYPESRVICFEPVKGTFDLLAKRLSKYKDRVILFNKALSDRNGEGEINITSFHGANSIEEQSQFHKDLNPHVFQVSKETISLVRLDDLKGELGGHRIDIMKIDVEGHELNVLRGGADFIKSNVDTLIVEMSLMRDESWENQSFVEIFSLLHSLGFRLVNLFDLHYDDNQNQKRNLMCVQVDCVFRHISKLNSHQ